MFKAISKIAGKIGKKGAKPLSSQSVNLRAIKVRGNSVSGPASSKTNSSNLSLPNSVTSRGDRVKAVGQDTVNKFRPKKSAPPIFSNRQMNKMTEKGKLPPITQKPAPKIFGRGDMKKMAKVGTPRPSPKAPKPSIAESARNRISAVRDAARNKTQDITSRMKTTPKTPQSNTTVIPKGELRYTPPKTKKSRSRLKDIAKIGAGTAALGGVGYYGYNKSKNR
jgi:hypothetical protein